MSINILNSKVIDDEYELRELEIDSERIISIMSSNSYQSLSYMDNEKVFEIYDSYPKLYDILSNLGAVNSVLVLGGGGFSYPKYYISHYSDKTMDVIEINSKLIDISFKYLYLDRLFAEHDPNHKRLNIYCTDAYDFIIKTNRKYDGVFIDLYVDNEPLDIIFEERFIYNIKRILNKDKFLSINYILHEGSLDKFYKFKELLSKYFTNTKIITTDYNVNLSDKNIFILCSDSDITIPDTYKYVEYER